MLYHHRRITTSRLYGTVILFIALWYFTGVLVKAQQPQQAISIISKPPTEAVVGKEYVYEVRTQQSVATLIAPTFTLNKAPKGMTIDEKKGVIRWIPQETGIVTVTLTASLGGTTATAGMKVSQTFVILVLRSNQQQFKYPLLEFITYPALETFVGLQYEYSVQAIIINPLILILPPDSSGRQKGIAYLLEKSPQGMTIDTATGKILWTPKEAGAFEVVVKAYTTNDTLKNTQSFKITVHSFDKIKMFFVSQPPPRTITGQEYVYHSFAMYGLQIPRSSNNEMDKPIVDLPIPIKVWQNNIVYSLEQSPEGTSIDTNGIVRWKTPLTASGTVTFSIKATLKANTSLSTTQTFSVEIKSRESLAVSFQSSSPREARVDREYQYDVQAIYNLHLFGVIPHLDFKPGVTKLSLFKFDSLLTYSLSTAPEGMTIDSRSGLIRWTPTATAIGTAKITVRAVVTTNATLYAEQSFEIKVLEAKPYSFRFVSSPPKEAQTNKEYVYYAMAQLSDGSIVIQPTPRDSINLPIPIRAADIRYSLLSAPKGMTIDTIKGVIRWTPTETGEVKVSVQAKATNIPGTSATLTVTQEFIIRVGVGPCVIIRGKVRYNDGGAVVQGAINAIPAPPDGQVSILPVYSAAIRNGEFELSVREGSYKLFVSGNDFATVWYNQVSSSDKATTITATCGENQERNFNVERYQPPKYYIVSGKVTRKLNSSAVPALVEFFVQNPPANVRLKPSSTRTDVNGNYKLALEDKYTYIARATSMLSSIQLLPMYYDGVTTESDATKITLTRDRDDINFALLDKTVLGQANNNDISFSAPSLFDEIAASQTKTADLNLNILTLMPNPANTQTTLLLPTEIKAVNVQCEIITTTGQVVFATSQPVIHQTLTLNVAGIPAGVYMLVLSSDNNRYRALLVISR